MQKQICFLKCNWVVAKIINNFRAHRIYRNGLKILFVYHLKRSVTVISTYYEYANLFIRHIFDSKALVWQALLRKLWSLIRLEVKQYSDPHKYCNEVSTIPMSLLLATEQVNNAWKSLGGIVVYFGVRHTGNFKNCFSLKNMGYFYPHIKCV